MSYPRSNNTVDLPCDLVSWEPRKAQCVLCMDTMLSLAWPEAAPGTEQSRWCSCHLEDRAGMEPGPPAVSPKRRGTEVLGRAARHRPGFPSRSCANQLSTAPTRVPGSWVWAPIHSLGDNWTPFSHRSPTGPVIQKRIMGG